MLQDIYQCPNSHQKKSFGNHCCRFLDILIFLEFNFQDRAKSKNLKSIFSEIDASTLGKSMFYKSKKKKVGCSNSPL